MVYFLKINYFEPEFETPVSKKVKVPIIEKVFKTIASEIYFVFLGHKKQPVSFSDDTKERDS